MENNSKISVIMGVYNCSSYISEAIDSILSQTYTDWELIICDDCSKDNTFDIVKSYSDKYPDKIIVMRNERNSYLAYSLNRCLEKATGYYVARMDGDDISTPDRFEKEVAFLKDHPEIDMVGCEMQHFNEKGLGDIVKVPSLPDKYILRNDQPFIHATIMTYKRVFDELDGYVVADRTIRGQDYDLWFRFYDKGFKGDNIHEPLYLMREDLNAVKRRTFKVRWNCFRTTVYGFNLLGYPKIWLIEAFFVTLFKSLVPAKIQFAYRRWQQIKYQKGSK